MKTSILFATGLVLAAGALVGSGSAQAGEGGTAGSVSIKFVTVAVPIAPAVPTANPAIRSISSSIAIGKNAAAATARTDATNTFTSGIGGGGGASVVGNVATEGGLAVSNANDTSAGYALQGDGQLNAVQLNTFSNGNNAATLDASGITLGTP